MTSRPVPARLVVALHGYEDDPSRLRDALEAAGVGVPIVAPSGPHAAPGGPSWVRSWAPPFARATGRLEAEPGDSARAGSPSEPLVPIQPTEPTPEELAVTLDELDAVIDGEVAARGLQRSEVAIGGFSQGAAVALALALRPRPGDTALDRAVPFAAVFVVCGFLWPPDVAAYDFARLASTPTLVIHGADDDVVPPAQGRSAARVLERRGAPVTLTEVAGVGHAPDPALALEVARWLRGLRRRDATEA